MPELPEVEEVVRGLSKHIIGQTIKDVVVKDKRSFQSSPSTSSGNKKLRGLKIKEISRRGKGIIVALEQRPRSKTSSKAERQTEGLPLSLLIHLKMTGQLIYEGNRSFDRLRMTKKSRHAEFSSASKNKILKRVQDDKLGERDDKFEKGRLNLGHPTKDFTSKMPSGHTRVIFKLSKGTLYFNDQRLFGWVKVLPTQELKNDPFIKKLGLEPISTSHVMSTTMNGRSSNWQVISSARLWAVTKRRPKSSIKAILLDQSVLTGLGNIYTDEVLFEAKIKPTRKGKSVTKKDAEKLIKAIKKVLTKGIKHSGTSIVNYKTPEGSPGTMQNHLKVYSRADLPCRKCKTPIAKTRVANRGTHYCPKCQR